MIFHHIGIATSNLTEAITIYQQLGFSLKDNNIYMDTLQKVKIGFMQKHGHPLIELITPFKVDSPVDKIIKKSGSSPYHTCYQVTDIEKTIKDLRKQHFIQIVKPTPAVAFNGRQICFLYHKAIGLIEILQGS